MLRPRLGAERETNLNRPTHVNVTSRDVLALGRAVLAIDDCDKKRHTENAAGSRVRKSAALSTTCEAARRPPAR
jgi:hypothetical protein